MSQITGTPARQANGAGADGNPVESSSVLASPAQAGPVSTEAPALTAPGYLRGLVVLTCVLVCVAILIYLLGRCAFLLEPLLIACLLSYVLAPVQRWFARRGLPRFATAAIMLLATAALVGGLVYLAFTGVHSLSADHLAEYEGRLDQTGRHLLARLGQADQAEHFRVRELLFSGNGLNIQLGDALASFTRPLFDFIALAVIVVLCTVFLWLEWADLPGRIEQAFGPERGARLREVGNQINDTISRYLGVLTLLCLMQATVALVTLGLLRVDFFVLWAVLFFLLCYIPYFGPFFAVSLPVLTAFVQYPDQPWRGIVALVVLAAVNQLSGNVLNPRLNGHKLGVSPLLILLALSFWGWLWGVVGVVLAVPLTVSIKIILERIEATRPIAILMSNR
jgi:predicted PurR-regulated permease PerM